MAKPNAETKSSQVSAFTKGYLITYNAIQTLGWGYLLLQIITYYANGDYREQRLWDNVKVTTTIFQNAAILEVFHAMLGLVRSSPIVTGVQVYSRVWVVCGILLLIPESADNNIGVTMALTAWSITEIIRYSFYALSLVNAVPYFLIWCRYTFFIALYPIGVTGELLCQYSASLVAGHLNLYSLDLPNSWNISFSYQYFIILNMLGYIPGFPPLYMYMLQQRKKMLRQTNGDQKRK